MKEHRVLSSTVTTNSVFFELLATPQLAVSEGDTQAQRGTRPVVSLALSPFHPADPPRASTAGPLRSCAESYGRIACDVGGAGVKSEMYITFFYDTRKYSPWGHMPSCR